MESSELQRPSVHELGGGAKGLERAQVAIELLDVREHGLLHRVDLVEGGEPHISRDLGPRRQLVERAHRDLVLRRLHRRRRGEVVAHLLRIRPKVAVEALLHLVGARVEVGVRIEVERIKGGSAPAPRQGPRWRARSS